MRPPRAAASALVAAALSAAVLSLAGCGAATVVSLDGSTTGLNGESTRASDLLTGDCVNAANGSILAGISLVSCGSDHDWEVYFQFGVDGSGADGTADDGTAGDGTAGDDGDAFPGDAALVAAAEEACATQFSVFLGTGSLGSTEHSSPVPDASEATAALGYTYLTPLEADWAGAEQHRVSCLIGDMNGRVSGTLAGAGSGSTAAG